jgi:acyl-CoA reductase-like NAD-dependent aldehyde dehydrogenase
MTTELHDIINPATEKVIAQIPLAGLAETDEAVARAVRAQESWREVAPADRARLLRRFAQAVEDDLEHLAGLEVDNAGHTIGNARWEAGNVRDVLTYYSAAPERLFGRQIPVAGGLDLTFKEPLGVVGIIVPWNFPMPIAGWGFAPALAAGNSVVLKPAELTPLTALRLGELALAAGIPADVFQILPGRGAVAGRRLVDHPDVRKIVFTGSPAVGREVMAGCAKQVKAVTLELGGKSANIVFADGDLEQAAASAPGAVFDNAGQDCCARSRILVEDSAYDRFMELLEAAVGKFVVGDPRHPDSAMGPLISAAHRDRVAAYVTDQTPVAFRGGAPEGPGYWYPPTVLTPAGGAEDRSCPAYTEEVFGPVVSVVRFTDEADAIRIANDSEYGLSGSIWTRDLGRALRTGRAVQSGNLSVNSHSSVRYSTPFGGFKQSGLGRELGPDALDAFTETKNIFIAH